MTTTFTSEQDALRTSVRRFLDRTSPTSEVRRLLATDEGYDPAVWRQMAEQLGLQALALPQAYGGDGFGVVEQVVVLEEMGRALLCSPYFASVVLAGTALAESGDEAAQRDLLPGIADGSTVATLAWVEDGGGWGVDALATTASRAGDGYLLDGAKTLVLDGRTAALVLVVAQTEAGPSLFALDPAAGGVSRRPLETLDLTRRAAALTLSAVPARLVGEPGGTAGTLERTLRRAVVALAAEQVGGAQRCLDTSVAYAQLRVQFGRPIGSFQAIKHRCADMLLEVESARSAVYHAAGALADGSPDLAAVVALTKACCSDAFADVATQNIQIHGGIGFTWEHDAHLFYRRALSSAQFLGSPAEHRDRLAGLLLAADPG